MRKLANIFWLGTKELRSFFARLRAARTGRLRVLARRHHAGAEQFAGAAQRLDRASSTRTIRSSRAGSRTRSCRPISSRRSTIAERDIDPADEHGRYTFVIDIPPNFQRDVLGRTPARRCRSMSTRPRWCRRASAPATRSRSSRPRSPIFSRTPRARRCRRSISPCASPSIRTSRPPGSPA